MATAPAAVPTGAGQPHNRIRAGYARVSTRGQDHQSQLDALAGANCREVVETASTRGERPKLRATLDRLQPGNTPDGTGPRIPFRHRERLCGALWRHHRE